MPKKYVCNGCGTDYDDKGTLTTHSKNPQRCLDAKKRRLDKIKLQVKSQAESVDQPIISELCDEKSPATNNLKLTLKNGDSLEIPVRATDSYVNATLLCKAGRKRVTDWKGGKLTRSIIRDLSGKTGISVSKLVEIRRGGNVANQGSWIHPDLTVHLAKWVDPSFESQVLKWMQHLEGKNEPGENVNVQLAQIDSKESIIDNKGNDGDEKFPAVVAFELTLENGDSLKIPVRESDAYVNATLLCQAGGKSFAHWKCNKTTEGLIQALSDDIGIPISELIEIRKGGNPSLQGSWIHPKLAIQLAQWVNTSFALQVSDWIIQLLSKGKVEIKDDNKIQPAENSLVIQQSSTQSFLDEQKSIIDGMIFSFKHLGPVYAKGVGVIYGAYLGEYDGHHYFKLGHTEDPVQRFEKLTRIFEGEFYPIILLPGPCVAEQEWKRKIKAKGHNKKYKDHNETETFYISEKFSLEEAISDLKRILFQLGQYEDVKVQFDKLKLEHELLQVKYESKLKESESRLRIKELESQLKINELESRLVIRELKMQSKCQNETEV